MNLNDPETYSTIMLEKMLEKRMNKKKVQNIIIYKKMSNKLDKILIMIVENFGLIISKILINYFLNQLIVMNEFDKYEKIIDFSKNELGYTDGNP